MDSSCAGTWQEGGQGSDQARHNREGAPRRNQGTQRDQSTPQEQPRRQGGRCSRTWTVPASMIMPRASCDDPLPCDDPSPASNAHQSIIKYLDWVMSHWSCVKLLQGSRYGAYVWAWWCAGHAAQHEPTMQADSRNWEHEPQQAPPPQQMLQGRGNASDDAGDDASDDASGDNPARPSFLPFQDLSIPRSLEAQLEREVGSWEGTPRNCGSAKQGDTSQLLCCRTGSYQDSACTMLHMPACP